MRLLFFTIFLLSLNSYLFGQTFFGKVINEKKQPLQEVNILNLSNNQHTHSNEQGNFTFGNIAVGDTLQFSHISHQTKQIVVSDLGASLEVTLDIELTYLDGVVISSEVNALNLISDLDIQTAPVNSSQDILRKVPGLFIGQHAGGGKAEQIFLRGFDIDHGTDINITVDGLPVNMVSHAHGQGYADLHFVIPETIEKVDFGKGLYYENKGNFNTAGYVDFVTKQKLKNNTLKLEAGQFNTYRLLGMFKVSDNKNHHAYVATEYSSSDGPFESPQNFNRINLYGKYTGTLNNKDKIGITLSQFSSKWDASGQVPQRAVNRGLITRFGAIDDTEGGQTSRSNLLVSLDKSIDENTSLKSTAYVSQYDFELYSNFTFFLEDPINGDQIKQKESRNIYGLNSELERRFSIGNLNGSWQTGISLRNDQSKDNELSHTVNRSQTIESIQLGNINETNIGAYLGTTLNLKKWTFNPSVRLDYFDFQYNDALVSEYKTQSQSETILSPKLNMVYHYSSRLQLYTKLGKGFHSNDTRVVIAREAKEILPAAYGLDAGFIWKPTSKMLVNIAYWYLDLEQEFVYVGDAGIVEPSGKTRRQGIDLSYRYQPLSWLFWNLDANYTYALAIEEAENENYIPLAPDFTLASSINIIHNSGFTGGINVRHLGNRPANEDNSIVAEGYTVVDLNAGYKWNKLNFGIQIQNLLNTEWNEAQFATESRLQNEVDPIEEIHFTPGTPFNIKGVIEYTF